MNAAADRLTSKISAENKHWDFPENVEGDEWPRERMLATFAADRPVVDVSSLASPVPREVWDAIPREAAVLDHVSIGWVVLS